MALLEGRDERGIPLKSGFDTICPKPKSVFVFYGKLLLIFSSFGLAVSYVAWHFADEKTQMKVDLITKYELGPIYLALYALQCGFQIHSAILGTARRDSKINVPDQQIYRVYGGAADGSYVLMDLEGDMGRFNRAQRALANLEEYLPLFLAKILVTGFVFPRYVAVIAVLFMCFRVNAAFGYVSDAKDRQGGTIAAFIMSGILDGMLLLIGAVSLSGESA